MLLGLCPSPFAAKIKKMKIHVLKTDPEHFSESMNGNKSCELRLDDRNYQNGDYLMLRETRYNHYNMSAGMPLKYTGRFILAKITNKFYDVSLGLHIGWCLLSIKVIEVGEW